MVRPTRDVALNLAAPMREGRKLRGHPTRGHGTLCVKYESLARPPMSLPTFLVEDNVLIQRNLIPALEELAGARIVGVAPSEPRAIEWLEGHPTEWKLAVVDLFLEQGTGLGVVAWCRARSVDQRVVVLTNYATADIAHQALASGADASFDKSVDLDAFFDFCIAHRLALHL